MSQHLLRGLLLLEQGKADLAEPELRAAVAEAPDEPVPRAMLSICLSERGHYAEATDEARRAIALGPDAAGGHSALAKALLHRNRADEAEAPAREAVRLDPDHADHRGTLALILYRLERWSDALAAADEGLALDPEHAGCRNLRAMALVKLGRRDEADATLKGGLEKDPENSLTHANQGWLHLERRDPRQALVHFRESLRLDPNNDYARAGLVEALKARFFVYRWFLAWLLWMARLGRGRQWLFILGLLIAVRVMDALGRSKTPFAPVFKAAVILYVLFVALTWFAEPLFNLALFLHRAGRLALSRDQYVGAVCFGAHLAALVAAIVGMLLGVPLAGFAALGLGLTLLPAAAIFRTPAGWPRSLMAAYTVGAAALFVGGILAAVAGEPDLAKKLTTGSVWACALAWLPANLLGSATVKS